MAEGTWFRSCLALLRNLFLATLLYVSLFCIIEVLRNQSTGATVKIGIPAILDKAGPAELIKTTKSGVKVRFAGFSEPVTINPHANVLNRPSSAVIPRDDYLGPRPHVDTEADLHMLVEECRGDYEVIEKMRNVFDCLKFLANAEDQYFKLPEVSKRASKQDPRQAEYLNADGHNNTLTSYISIDDAMNPSKDSLGNCPGPIVPYHVYWAGPATWRVELFIKSYLYTQNLPCSRLWLWLDSDRNQNAVDDMLNRDALFARFIPLVERGDIILMSWHFPSRVPLPKNEDNTDGIGYYKTPGKPNAEGEVAIADGIIEDYNGQQWLLLAAKQSSYLPVVVSDAVRFVVLHIYGGAYFDMDIILLRDMRPLIIPRQHSFAERWAAHPHPGDYNTAVMSLTANSSLSSYLLRGGVRMGLNFHPRVVGRMAWKDGRNHQLLMLETAAFDPIWTEFNWDREGRCTVPCLRDYSAAFKGTVGGIKDEWESYDSEHLPLIDLSQEGQGIDIRAHDMEYAQDEKKRAKVDVATKGGDNASAASAIPSGEDMFSFDAISDMEQLLRKAGVIERYVLEEDKFPPNNRTLENFFRGAWTYHIHNQWLKHPEPNSWFSIIQLAQDNFFAGNRTNPYGESWEGPRLMRYNYWPMFV